MNGFYSEEELQKFGFKSLGENVQISKKACIYGAENISIGSNVRIDDFCVLIGNIILRSYIHLAAFCSLHAGEGTIFIDDYSVLGAKVTIYASEIDFKGEYMFGPMIPTEYCNRICSEITIGKFVIIGTNSSIVFGSIIPDGVAVGAMSLVKKELEPWGIYAGVPCKKIKERSRKLLELAEEFESQEE